MKLQFLGAARQVTGSQYYVEADGARLLVDCGMYQERAYLARNWDPSPIRLRDLDALLLTHAHVDHCGLAPKLVQDGFRSPIITTYASADLVELVLRDAAEIQAEDAAFKEKRHRKEGRRGERPVKPLYTMRDVDRTLPLLESVPYDQPVRINDHVQAVFHDAGHILGSAMIELRVSDHGQPRRIVFTGDLGQWDRPIVRNPTVFTEADYVVMESTYGDRDHENHDSVESQLEKVVSETVAAGGKVIIPIFAIERAQELIYHLNRLLQAEHIPEVPVFLDSPMAADVNEVFRRHRECFDAEAEEIVAAGGSLLKFPSLRVVRERGGVEGDQRPEGAGHHHGHLGHVYGGPHQAPPGPAHRRPGLHDPLRRLPVARHAGPANPRRQPGGPHPRHFPPGPRPGRADSGHLRPRRPRRPAEVARPFPAAAAPTVHHPRRAAGVAGAGRSKFASRWAGTSACPSIEKR